MGAADVLPGVSGGTMSLILGIYDELLQAIHAVDLDFIRFLLALRWTPAAFALAAPEQSRGEPRRQRRDGVRRRVWYWLIAACCRSRFLRASAPCCWNSA